MRKRNFTVDDRNMFFVDDVPLTGSENVDILAFSFDSDWDGLVKTAIFSKDGHIYNENLINDEVTVPEVIYATPGKVTLYLKGRSEERTLYSFPYVLEVAESGYQLQDVDIENLPDSETWDLYTDQMLALLAQAQDTKADCEVIKTAIIDLQTAINNTAQGVAIDAATVARLKAEIEQAIADANLKIADYNANATEKTNEFNRNALAWQNAINTAGNRNVSNVEAEGTTQKGNVTEEGTKQVKDVKDEGTRQVGNVEQAGEDAVSDVNTAKTEAVGAIEDAEDTALEHIEQAGANYDTRLDNLEAVTGTGTDTFSTESTYAVGDVVVHDNKVYRCITAITTAGAWDSTKWEEINVRQEQDEQNEKIAYLEEHVELMESNYNTDTTEPSSDIHITDSLNGYNQGIAVGGNTTQDGIPAPDNPVDIVDTTGTQEIIDKNKNLFPIASPFTISATRTVSIKLKAGKHTFSWSSSVLSTGGSGKGLARINYIDNTYLDVVITYSSSSQTVTLSKNTKSILFYVSTTYNDSVGKTRTIYDFMIEEGSTATPYIPHKGSSITLHLGDIHLGNLGTAENVLFKNIESCKYYDSSLDYGAWYYRQELSRITFSGVEGWTKGSNANFSYYYTRSHDSELARMVDTLPLSNRLKGIGATTSAVANSFQITGGDASIRVYMDPEVFSGTGSEFASWMNTNSVELRTISKEPITTKITSSNYPELYADLQELEKTQTYREHTIIQVTPAEGNTGNPAQLEVTYLKDDRVEQAEEISNIKSALLSLGAQI